MKHDWEIHDLMVEAQSLRERSERAEALLRRISEWDMMDTAADGPHWRREIAAVLNQQFTKEE